MFTKKGEQIHRGAFLCDTDCRGVIYGGQEGWHFNPLLTGFLSSEISTYSTVGSPKTRYLYVVHVYDYRYH